MRLRILKAIWGCIAFIDKLLSPITAPWCHIGEACKGLSKSKAGWFESACAKVDKSWDEEAKRFESHLGKEAGVVE